MSYSTLLHPNTHTHTPQRLNFPRRDKKHTYQLLQPEKLEAALMFDTCSGAPWHMQTHLGQSSLIYQWQWSLSDRRLCQALVKKQSNFFLTAFVCANAMETPYLHGNTSDPGTGGIFFLSSERHGLGVCGGSDITSRDCTFQIWWITECQSSTRTNLSGFLLTAQLIVKLLTNKEDSTLDVRTWLSGMKKKMFYVLLQL